MYNTENKKVVHSDRLLSLALQFVRKCEYKERTDGNKNKKKLVLFLGIALETASLKMKFAAKMKLLVEFVKVLMSNSLAFGKL